MKTLLMLLVIFPASLVCADQFKMVETATGVYVENTGTPSDSGSLEKSSATAAPRIMTREEYLKSEVGKLQGEVDKLLKFTGKESKSEVKKRTALADEKKRRIAIFENEIRRIEEKSRLNEKPSVTQQNKRQEMKREVQELKNQRMTSPTSP